MLLAILYTGITTQASLMERSMARFDRLEGGYSNGLGGDSM